ARRPWLGSRVSANGVRGGAPAGPGAEPRSRGGHGVSPCGVWGGAPQRGPGRSPAIGGRGPGWGACYGCGPTARASRGSGGRPCSQGDDIETPSETRGTRTLQFDDNGHLRELVGEFGSNLKLIGSALGVTVEQRGNGVRVLADDGDRRADQAVKLI